MDEQVLQKLSRRKGATNTLIPLLINSETETIPSNVHLK